MRRSRAFALLAVPLCFLLAAKADWSPPDAAEVTRVRDHLWRVARAMRSEVGGDLTEQQAEARQTVLSWLDEYRAAGVFPHNHVRPGERVPVFVDPHGTPCAVGYLMARSGRLDLVEDIVRANNLIRIHELRDDERVAAWLDTHGITLEEAALIQPSYTYYPPSTDPAPVSSSYRPATVGLSVASVALASYTAMVGAERGAPWVDVLAFGTTMGHTYMILNANDTPAEEPMWAVGLNVVGLVASVGSEVLRMARGSDARDPGSVVVRPYVAPGRNGTEIGFAIR